MHRTARQRRAPARLATLCTVLFGLFLMHGSPASAATGCHGLLLPASPHASVRGTGSHDASTHGMATAHPGAHGMGSPHASAHGMGSPHTGAQGADSHRSGAHGMADRGANLAAGPSAVAFPTSVADAPATPCPHGTQCVATPARDSVPLPSAGQPTGVVTVDHFGRPSTAFLTPGTGTGRRGPPAGGRALLTRVGVART